jgi:peptidoglycan/xylan/chitin deacetylase (PgdA/CDA1 family)
MAVRMLERTPLLRRRAVRSVLRPAISLFGAPLATLAESALRWTSRRVGVAVMYHSVADVQGNPDRELVAPHGTELFERQLRHLESRYRVVAAADLLDAVRSRRRGERFPVAVTFDDDLACHARIALPVLRRVGVEATFFLCGTSLEEPFSYWWERLQRAYDLGLDDLEELVGGASADEGPRRGRRGSIHELGRRIEEMAPAERDAVSARLADRLGRDPADAGLRRADVSALVAGGMTIGFHTVRHDRLPDLNDDALARALTDGRERLEAIAGRRLDVIGYPHGAADRRVAAAARTAGFRTGFTVTGRPVGPDSDPLLLGRIAPSYRSAGHFAVQLVLELASSPR